VVSLECSGGEHTQEACHATDASVFLNFKQRQAVARVVKSHPSMSGAEVRRAVSRGSPSGKIRAGLIRSVRSVVKVQKQKTLADMTGGVLVTDSYASIAALGDRLWFGDILRRHNSGEMHFSNPHEVFCIGNVSPEAAGEEIFLNVTTFWSIMHIARGHVSGWPNCLSGDGTGKVSRHQVTMVSLGINSIPAKFNALNFCIGPVENQDLFTRAWDGVEKTYFAFMNKWKCCNMSYAHCGTCALISYFRNEPSVKEHIGEDGDKKLIEKAKSDNTDLFRNFAKTISAIPLVCDAHGAGICIVFAFVKKIDISSVVAAIPFNQGTHLKYFTKGKEVYDVYYGHMLRCSAIFDPAHKEMMYEKMIHFLRTEDSDRTAEWWAKHWKQPFTLADCGYGNCTHQNHQEGTWRPVKRGTGCGAKGDERQALGTFVSKLVDFTKSASEESEAKMIELGRPNAFVRDPQPSKKEWDHVQALHPKVWLLSVPLMLSAADTTSFAELTTEIMWTSGGPHVLSQEPVYLKIQNYHASQLQEWIARGNKEANYKSVMKKKWLDSIVMPTNKLMFELDPCKTRSLESVMTDLTPYIMDFRAFLLQHTDEHRATVADWSLEHYLDVLDSMRLVTRITPAWGQLQFKCSCKHCHVHGCCRETVICSMLLDHTLKIPGKYAHLTPGIRKRRGKPTDKRVAKLKAGAEDARAFVDKASPRV